MALPSRWLSQLIGTFGLLSLGDIRTRVGNTGGGDVYARHMLLGPAAFLQMCDPSGDAYVKMGASGSPSQDFELVIDPTGANFPALQVDNDSDIGLVNIQKLKRYTCIGLPMGVVNGSIAIPTGEIARARCNGTWSIVDWVMLTDLGGPYRVRIWKTTYATYSGVAPATDMSGTGTGTGGMPRTVLGTVKNTGGGNVSGWTTTDINDGDLISAECTLNTAACKWAYLALIGTKREAA